MLQITESNKLTHVQVIAIYWFAKITDQIKVYINKIALPLCTILWFGLSLMVIIDTHDNIFFIITWSLSKRHCLPLWHLWKGGNYQKIPTVYKLTTDQIFCLLFFSTYYHARKGSHSILSGLQRDVPPKTENECGTKGSSKCLGRAWYSRHITILRV